VLRVTTPPTQLPVIWPVAPDYMAARGPNPKTAWVTYKLGSAAWYIDALKQLGQVTDYTRLVGIEMALDGAVAALCAAFDAAHRALVTAVYQRVGQALPPPPQFPNAQVYGRILMNEGGDIAQIHQDVLAATTRDGNGTALGWLVILKDLRNRMIHQDSLSRFIEVNVGAPDTTTTGLSLPGAQAAVHPVTYLQGAYSNRTAGAATRTWHVSGRSPIGYGLGRANPWPSDVWRHQQLGRGAKGLDPVECGGEALTGVVVAGGLV